MVLSGRRRDAGAGYETEGRRFEYCLARYRKARFAGKTYLGHALCPALHLLDATLQFEATFSRDHTGRRGRWGHRGSGPRSTRPGLFGGDEMAVEAGRAFRYAIVRMHLGLIATEEIL